ncbi:glycosyltransferase family 2 protein [Geobacter sp. DSM 9736]|uniref:glycosyltransferase family 2 protein n=1 Tax=Geobacter sp. DSM 9736 TaxID=1277350 RepID=UPI000B5EE531|nr:glycosyltransferase family 2 protein [Geobacter sp. DSM 9736]SNB46618.1 Glycosyl transferase family 2 [Geobacter sp. DSM 9736]
MTGLPKITIVTPSYNQGKFLEKTILSVLDQGYPNLEYIIIDGGSTDGSVDIIRRYEKHLAYWVSEPDRGQSHALNKGFERATGEIFGWLNSDDWYLPGALNAVAESFAAQPDAGAIVGAGEMYFEETGTSMLFEPYPLTLKSLFQAIHKHIMQPSCFFAQAAWRDCGPLDEALHLAMDFDLWLRIAKKYSFTTIRNNLSVSRVHASAKTTAMAAESYADSIFVMHRNGGESEARACLVEFLSELLVKRRETIHLQNELYHSIKSREQEREELRKQITAIHGSLSWKITQPLRLCCDVLLKLIR